MISEGTEAYNEVTTCRNRVETYPIVIKQDLLFFIILDCVNQRKSFFYLQVLFGNNFAQFDKSPGKYSSKTCQVEIKPVCNQTFFMKVLLSATALKTQIIISESMMEEDMIGETQTLEWRKAMLSLS